MNQFIVDATGNGDFTTVQAAIDAAPEHSTKKITIQIKKGTYTERIVIPEHKPNIHLIGEDREETVLVYHNTANMRGPDGEKLRISGSASTYVYADDFSAKQITFANSAGLTAGQAVALYAGGDRLVFQECNILGHQDTLFTPSNGRQYYKDCYIAGTVDFICGSAICLFENCELFSIDRHNGYVAAPATAEELPYGYVFLNCRLTGSTAKHTVTLARPWQPYGQAHFVNCWMGEHIRPAGWDNWRDPEKEKTATFAEYRSSGPGATPDERLSWAKQLTQEEAAKLTVPEVLSGADGWDPIAMIS